MSDMEVGKSGMFHKLGNFVKREIEGDKKQEEEGTWSNSTLDYVTKGGVTGGLLGAGMGAAAHYAAGDAQSKTYKYEVPVMENKKIGEIPSNHVANSPDIPDPAFVDANGKPVDGKGVGVYGNVPQRGILGGFKMEEKTAEVNTKGSTLLGSVLGGALIGTLAGVLAGVALKLINGIIHPTQNQAPWSNAAPPAWSNAAPPEWKNSSAGQPWSKSAPAWSNTHNKAPWSDVHSRTHSNYSDTHYRSHSNYSDTHYRSHDNYSNSHSNSWDRHVSY
ncbi:MAG: hypothetical protein RDV48_22330 [Candidatus Eremiobacteraeota bacterium]|nr:hypothetical protein [Candidatus Eremiobacteraeota bacterium]